MKKIFVIARDHKEYDFYTRRSPLFEFLSRPEQFIGRRGDYYIIVGEAYLRSDYEEILGNVQYREFIKIDL